MAHHRPWRIIHPAYSSLVPPEARGAEARSASRICGYCHQATGGARGRQKVGLAAGVAPVRADTE